MFAIRFLRRIKTADNKDTIFQMTLLQAAMLGTIQGLSEFLPISSSGHLVLTRHLFGIPAPGLFFDTSVHIGTMLAVIVVFRKDLGDLFVALARAVRNIPGKGAGGYSDREKTSLRLALLILIGSVPTAILGAGLKVLFTDKGLSSVWLVGLMLIVTALILWLTRGRGDNGREIIDFGAGRAILVGCAQGLAVIPGMSRSGATIATGLFLGLNSEDAARLSFLLSIPAILGAQLLSSRGLMISGGGGAPLAWPAFIGAVTSFLVGYLALRILLRIISHGRLHLFAPYCLVVGLVVIISSLT